MELHKKCSACKRHKLWFLVRKRVYIGKDLPSGKLTSDTEVCKRCHENANMIILGKPSLRHRINHGIMNLRIKYDALRNQKAQ